MKECIMSFFNAPISNQVPSGVTSVKQLHTYITSNEWLKERTLSVQDALSDEKRFRKLKQNLLPYVTPAGVFSYRKEDRLLFLSGEFGHRYRPSPLAGRKPSTGRDTLVRRK